MYINSPFKAPWWAKNRHLQTLWGGVMRPLPEIPTMQRQRLELDDGDFIDVDLFMDNPGPVVLLLHGLEGSVNSHYLRGTLASLHRLGLKVAVKYFRGCSGQLNRLPASYHSGKSEDLHTVIELLAVEGVKVEYLVGFSLGGNVTLKWLGEARERFDVKGAVAVCVPLLLEACADAVEKGFSRIYLNHLLTSLKSKALAKKQQFGDLLGLSAQEIEQLDNFWSFDQVVTAPLNGFADVQDYYRQSSAQHYLADIDIPTLIIHSEDDPFMSCEVLPSESQLSAHVTFELSQQGGHVGFVSGKWPWAAEYYLEKRIPEFIQQVEKKEILQPRVFEQPLYNS